MSFNAEDNFFFINYDFLNLLEKMKGGEALPSELFLDWQMRKTNNIEETLKKLFRWVDD